MLPQNAITSIPYYAEFLTPDDAAYDPLIDYEMGGIEINDASQGRNVRSYTCFLEGDNIYVAPSDDLVLGRALLVTEPYITSVSIAFDSNMSTTLAYMQGGILKLQWYDSVIEGWRTTEYPGATSGRVTADDKRATAEGNSDVIFAYVYNNVLYYRQQRDRYTVARMIGPALGTLTRIGMNAINRLQFEIS